ALIAGRRHAGGAQQDPAAAGHRGRDRGRPAPHRDQDAGFRANLAEAFRGHRRPLLPAGRPRGADGEARRLGVIYALRHRTTYNYEEPVTFARCVLRLTPRTSATQTVLANTVTVTPRP